MKCNYVNRVSLNTSVIIEGASLNRCGAEAAPGLHCCWDHADKETLILYAQILLREKKKYIAQLQLIINKANNNEHVK